MLDMVTKAAGPWHEWRPSTSWLVVCSPLSAKTPFGTRKRTEYRAGAMRFSAWVPLVLLLAPSGAQAACNQAFAGLGCFDATPGQGPAEPSRFQWFSEGTVLAPASWALALNYRFVDSPLQIAAPSGMPGGRTANVVSKTNRLELRAAAGLGHALDVSLAVPFSVAQNGSGSESVSSQNPTPIEASGLGDLRLALRTQLPGKSRYFDWTLRLEMTLPTGNEAAYLGSTGATEAVTTNLAFHYDRLLVIADFGGRVTKAQRFADVVMGPHLLVGLGVALDILPKEWLTLAIEGQARPMLSSTSALVSTDSAATRSRATAVIPAEWMLSVSSRPFQFSSVSSHPTNLPIWVSLGAGTGLGLSQREVEKTSTFDSAPIEPRLAESFYAPTSPKLTVSASASTRF